MDGEAMSAPTPWQQIRAAEFRRAADICDDLEQALATIDEWEMPRKLRRRLRRLRRVLVGSRFTAP